jgi:hypothetical protein
MKAAPVVFTPRDAFDPEIFNRQVAAAQEAQQPRLTESAALDADELISPLAEAVGGATSSAATELLPAVE